MVKIVAVHLLTTPVTMVHESGGRISTANRHLQHIHNSSGIDQIAHRPTHHLTRIHIQYHRHVQPALVCLLYSFMLEEIVALHVTDR